MIISIVVMITIAILLLLLQKAGTSTIGKAFGLIMTLVLVLGVPHGCCIDMFADI